MADNHQPWQVAVLTGKSKNNLCNKLVLLNSRDPRFKFTRFVANALSRPTTQGGDQGW